jgi:hypothetical protein
MAPQPTGDRQTARTDQAPAGLQSEPFAPAAPPLDVDRVTTEVVRAIDRRILAQRERFGRI